MEIPLKQIAPTINGSLRHGIKHLIYGLDEDGNMWRYSPRADKWERMDNPRTGAGKAQPDDTGDYTPNWKEI